MEEKIAKPVCPKCDSQNLYYRLKEDNWICRICGTVSKRDEVMHSNNGSKKE